jgi:hypothetical protein
MATTHVTFDPIAIEANLNQLTKILPLMTMFFPPLKVAIPFLPVIQGLLDMAKDLEAAQHDPETIINILTARLQDISGKLEAALPPPSPPPAQPAV